MAQKRKQKRKKSKRWIYWIIFVVLFVGAAVVCYFVWDAYFKIKDGGSSSGNNSKVEETDKKDKQEQTEINNKEEEIIEKEKVVQYEGSDPNEAEELTGAVTYAGVSGDMLVVRTNIDQFLTVGECELTLERGGEIIYNNVVNIVSSVSTSSCDGFEVPVDEIGGGEIDIYINLTSEGRMGTLQRKASI